MNVLDFQKMKQQQKKISMVTSYDYWSAQLIESSNIDCILVGDSAAMVIHGHSTTIPASVEMMIPHVQAVSRAAKTKFIIGDLPFCSYRKGLTHAMKAVDAMMKAGSHALKLEGAQGNFKLIHHMVLSGVPVMGHLGLTPQSIHALGGFKIQGRNEKAIQQLFKDAHALQDAGCFALVLECIPFQVAQELTSALAIPTIGIGAGPYTDGQVLVFQDLLGLQPNDKLKFVKKYLNGFELIQKSLDQYHHEVKNTIFPGIQEHSFASFKTKVSAKEEEYGCH